MRFTLRSISADTAIAIARYVLPVPAGPMPNTMSFERIASTYCFCATPFGEICRPPALQHLEQLLEQLGGELDRRVVRAREAQVRAALADLDAQAALDELEVLV